MLRRLSCVLVIIAAWMAVDLALHRLVLAPLYEASAALWRPFGEMRIGAIYGVTGALAVLHLALYEIFVSPKSVLRGTAFGLGLGLLSGLGVGVGTYIHQPLPGGIALGWLVGGTLKGAIAGVTLGWLVRAPR